MASIPLRCHFVLAKTNVIYATVQPSYVHWWAPSTTFFTYDSVCMSKVKKYLLHATCISKMLILIGRIVAVAAAHALLLHSIVNCKSRVGIHARHAANKNTCVLDHSYDFCVRTET